MFHGYVRLPEGRWYWVVAGDSSFEEESSITNFMSLIQPSWNLVEAKAGKRLQGLLVLNTFLQKPETSSSKVFTSETQVASFKLQCFQSSEGKRIWFTLRFPNNLKKQVNIQPEILPNHVVLKPTDHSSTIYARLLWQTQQFVCVLHLRDGDCRTMMAQTIIRCIFIHVGIL